MEAQLSADHYHPTAVSDTARRLSRGRPRQPATDAAILEATVDLLTEVGIGGTTTNAIVARSGCSEAMERGETDPTVDRDLLFDLIYGVPMDRVFVGETVDEAAVEALSDLVMSGAAGPRYRNRSPKTGPRIGADATAKG